MRNALALLFLAALPTSLAACDGGGMPDTGPCEGNCSDFGGSGGQASAAGTGGGAGSVAGTGGGGSGGQVASGAAGASGGGLCVPGASVACVGPAACQGGQVCKADGSGFGPCDCGAGGQGGQGGASAGAAGVGGSGGAGGSTAGAGGQGGAGTGGSAGSPTAGQAGAAGEAGAGSGGKGGSSGAGAAGASGEGGASGGGSGGATCSPANKPPTSGKMCAGCSPSTKTAILPSIPVTFGLSTSSGDASVTLTSGHVEQSGKVIGQGTPACGLHLQSAMFAGQVVFRVATKASEPANATVRVNFPPNPSNPCGPFPGPPTLMSVDVTYEKEGAFTTSGAFGCEDLGDATGACPSPSGSDVVACIQCDDGASCGSVVTEIRDKLLETSRGLLGGAIQRHLASVGHGHCPTNPSEAFLGSVCPVPHFPIDLLP